LSLRIFSISWQSLLLLTGLSAKKTLVFDYSEFWLILYDLTSSITSRLVWTTGFARRHGGGDLKSSTFYRAVYAVVVCPSVRLSVARRCCTKTAKLRITQITPYTIARIHGFYSFLTLKMSLSAKFQRGHPYGAPNRGGVG